MEKELIFLCWEENLKKEIEGIIDFLCLKPLCFDDVEKFYNKIEKIEDFVAIIDVFLTKENGYLVCKKIKEKFENSKVYLTVSRGLSKNELMERWGADGIIYKPIEWKEIEEYLLKEAIEFIPPPRDGKTDFEGLIRVLSDPLQTLRSCEVQINDERIKVSYGWLEKGDIQKLHSELEEEEIYYSFSPLKEPLSEESIVHLSEVLREITKTKRGYTYISLEEKPPSINLIKKDRLWFLTPYEINLIKKIEKGLLEYIDEEKKKMEHTLYFLSLLGIISVEKVEKPSTTQIEEVREEMEEKETIAEEPVEKEEIQPSQPDVSPQRSYELELAPPEEEIEKEDMKTEEPVEKEEIQPSQPDVSPQRRDGLELAPPEEEEEERKGEELEALKKYPEEKFKIMSTYEEVKEDEYLLEEILPPVRLQDEKREEPAQELRLPEERRVEEKISQKTVAVEERKRKIPMKPVAPAERKKEKKKNLFLKVLPIPLILLGVLLFAILKREARIEKELEKAERLLTLTKEEFLKDYENIKREEVKIALQAIGYEVGWFKSIPTLPKCKEKNLCPLLMEYISLLNGNLPSSIKEAKGGLIQEFLAKRLLLSVDKKRGALSLEEMGLPMAQYIVIKEACDITSFKKVEEVLERFPDDWKKKTLLCAWSRKNYDFVLKHFKEVEKKDPEIMMIVGLSYLERGNEEGVKVLEKINSSSAYYQIGNFMEKNGRIEEAIKYYSMVKDGEYLEPAKKKLRSLEKPAEAKLPPKPTVKDKKEDVNKLIGMAVFERRRGNTQEAIRLLNSILKIEPQNPDANYHLGMIMLETGDFELAKKHLKMFLNSAPPDDGRRKEISTLLETLP